MCKRFSVDVGHRRARQLLGHARRPRGDGVTVDTVNQLTHVQVPVVLRLPRCRVLASVRIRDHFNVVVSFERRSRSDVDVSVVVRTRHHNGGLYVVDVSVVLRTRHHDCCLDVIVLVNVGRDVDQVFPIWRTWMRFFSSFDTINY